MVSDVARVTPDFPWDENGGWLRSSRAIPAHMIGVDPDGTVRWTVDPRRPDFDTSNIATAPMLLDDQGVVYILMTNFLGFELAAIQTDILPPTRDNCVDVACNARRDFWARAVGGND